MELLVVLLIGIFLLGVGTAIWLVVRALSGLFGSSPEESPPHSRTARRAESSPYPSGYASPSRFVEPPSRAEVLRLLQIEVHRAARDGLIRPDVQQEMLDYISRERHELLGIKSLDPTGTAPPQESEAPLVAPSVTPAQVPAQPGEAPKNQAARAEALPSAQEFLALGASAAEMDLSGASATELPASPAATPALQDPDRMRKAIARLHADAQAPEAPQADAQAALTPQAPAGARAEALPAVPEAAAAVAKSESKDDSAALFQSATPPAAASGETDEPLLRSRAYHPAPAPLRAPAVPAKTFAERLFTPENVHILQSLGIGIIFISAAAFVKSWMWKDASSAGRLALLLGGTAACLGLGYAVRRWTGLRITGLGFMILGHLALILDAYAALLQPATDQAALYPCSPSSLWTLALLLFTASAAWHAHKLQEPLFEAFSFFGGLATWGSGVFWLGIADELAPAACVPLWGACGGLSAWFYRRAKEPGGGEEREGPQAQDGTQAREHTQVLRRWSLGWWFESAWWAGGALGAFVLPFCAWYAGAELAGQLGWHRAGMLALSSGLLVQALYRKNSSAAAHLGAVLLLAQVPLTAYVHAWPYAELDLALVFPGAGMALLALALRFRPPGGSEAFRGAWRERLGRPLSWWGLAASVAGTCWACVMWVEELTTPGQAAWATGAVLAVALAFALLESAPWATWLAVACASLLMGSVLESTGVSRDWWPASGLGLGLLLQVFWTVLRKRQAAVAEQGQRSGDALALLSALFLSLESPWLPAAAAQTTPALCAGWAALAIFMLATSIWELRERTIRACLGLTLLSPALAFFLYQLGFAFYEPAPWMALLALSALGGALLWSRNWTEEERRRFRQWACAGIAVILVHGTVLAWYGARHGAHFFALASFALLAVVAAIFATWLRAQDLREAGSGCEMAALGLLAAAGVNASWGWEVPRSLSVLVYEALAGGVLLVSLAGESVAGAWLQARRTGQRGVGEITPEESDPGSKDSLGGDVPFHAAGGWVALALTAISGLLLLQPWKGLLRHSDLHLYATWAAALVPLHLALRRQFAPTKGVGTGAAPDFVGLSGAVLASLLTLSASYQSLRFEFWEPACRANFRLACIVFFAVSLLVSLGAGLALRALFSPLVGTWALTGLAGCAYGAFSVPHESWGLACGLLSVVAWRLGTRAGGMGAVSDHQDLFSKIFKGSSISVAILGGIYLLYGLAAWPAGPTHAYAVAAWGLAAWGGWRIARKVSKEGHAFVASGAAGVAVLLLVCHALRATGMEFASFGPGLAGASLLLLAWREGIRFSAQASAVESAGTLPDLAPPAGDFLSRGRVQGLLGAAVLGGLGGLLFGWSGGRLAGEWFWSATLFEEALLLAVLCLTERRESAGAPASRWLLLELSAWGLLAWGVRTAWELSLPEVPFRADLWVLAGAVFVVLGMAGESIAGAVLGPKRSQDVPSAFLESRHLAALGLCALAVLCILVQRAPLHLPALQTTWHALLAAAMLCLYLSLAEWSRNSVWTSAGRHLSGFLTYVVFQPAGYLCLLKSHATGSSWGALWFLALAPVELVAASLLGREKSAAWSGPARMARSGAACVSLGALALAFLGNRERLPEIPAITFLAVAALALGARALASPSVRASYTLAICLLLSAAVFFGLRAYGDRPAWGASEPWPVEWTGLTAFGLALTVFGGALRLEADAKGRSQAGLFGGYLSAFALVFTAVVTLQLAPSPARCDPLIASTFIFAGTCGAAYGWLKYAQGGVACGVAILAGYFQLAWRWQWESWEWYASPAALFLFAWAWQSAREADPERDPEERKARVNLLLGLGCLLALGPSLGQALPDAPEMLPHLLALWGFGICLVLGAMWTRRKVPLLAGSGAVLAGTLIKTAQWAAGHKIFLPALGIAVGFAVLLAGCLFESRMNRAFRQAVDRAKTEARMFWSSWQ